MRKPRHDSGFAMVAVLLVLLALFVLCAPFLLTVRNADKSSAQLADRAEARIALDSAQRHARSNLGGSHPALDPTPYHDSLQELEVTNRFDEDFLNASDPTGPMWDLEVEDIAGRIDLNSASPHVLGNLLGGVARLTAPVDKDAKSIGVNSTAGFLEQGFLWVESELIGYGEVEASTFGKLARGIGVQLDEEGAPVRCAPQPPGDHPLGTYALDQRMWAFARWRQLTASAGRLGLYTAIEDVADAELFAMIEELGPNIYPVLERATSVYGGVRAGVQWQHGARVVGTISGQPDYGCTLPLEDARYFNAGTTVMITDGLTTEFGIVQVADANGIQLMDAVTQEYEPYTAVVYPLARRPVNVNTASIEVLRALMLNLKLKGRSARLTKAEVEDLIEVIVESRPFEGLEDFMRRVVLPAAGLDELPTDAPVVPEIFAALGQMTETAEDGTKSYTGFIDEDDARALYKNALNANDSELEFSTMPFTFTSRDVYRMELRSSINARNGVERANRRREVVELVVPQRDLIEVWARQEDFDEAPRLGRTAPFWMSGPEATRRFDPLFKSPFPTEARAHLGRYDSIPSVDPLAEQAVYTFPSREDQVAWLQLAPHRTDETGERAGRVLHFDDETRDLEGRYMPDGAVYMAPDDSKVQWGANGGLLAPLSCELWIKPRDLQDGEMYLDLGGPFPDTDKVSLMLDGADLVLRVLDGAGDHPETGFEEITEVRYPLGEGPGLPLDIWTHVEIRVAGNRPDQVTMLVDGRWSVDTPGLTRLTAGLSADSTSIAVESTDGFPDECVIRIGDELIEVTKSGQNAFDATFAGSGARAGFGGRLAREFYQGAEPNEINMALSSKDTAHPEGSSVQVYGYSLPVFSNVPSGSGALGSNLGTFAVARAVGIVRGGSEELEEMMDPIAIQNDLGFPVLYGYGLAGDSDDVTGLVLESADEGRDINEVMQAFSSTGGYAALLSFEWSLEGRSQSGSAERREDIGGFRLGGVEVVHYSGFNGNQLNIDRRGDRVTELQSLSGSVMATKASYLFHWIDPNAGLNTFTAATVKVVPISVPVRGAGGVSSFLPAQVGDSNFAQITPPAGQSELTEWVRYDEIVGDQLVRDDPNTLLALNEAAIGRVGIPDPDSIAPGPGSGGNGGFTPGGNLLIEPPTELELTKPAPTKVQGPGGAYWHYGIGQSEILNYPVTQAIASQFQFRGVLGTHSHTHASGALVTPVWKVVDLDETGGRPGALDRVMLFDEDPGLPGFPGRVQHAHRPFEYTIYEYDSGDNFAATGSEGTAVGQVGFQTTVTYVALNQPLNIPIAASASPGDGRDTRLQSRIVLYPSGERPRQTSALAIGGGYQGGAVPSAVVDEVAFGNDLVDGQFVIRTVFSEGAEDLEVQPDTLRTPAGDWNVQNSLSNLPDEAGLLRIGDEVVAYDNLDAGSGTIHVPGNSRGLLGTDAQNHPVGTGVSFLESWRVATLAGDIGADDGELPIVGGAEFPTSGTVLIDDELIHYTQRLGNALAMPRSSTEPGAMDRRGGGIFRGRFGTAAAGHTSGAAVIFFPFRYWDRWADRADAPEMSYFEFSIDQPDAFWKRVFWDVENPSVFGPRLGVLQKIDPDAPWDADPEENFALSELLEGKLDREGNNIGAQSDRAAWRAFIEYEPGAFDPVDGLSHGWKTTPRLRLFGVEYMGPNKTLRRVDR